VPFKDDPSRVNVMGPGSTYIGILARCWASTGGGAKPPKHDAADITAKDSPVVRERYPGRTRTCGLLVRAIALAEGLEPPANDLDLVYCCWKDSWDYATPCHRSRTLAANAGRYTWCLARSRTPGGTCSLARFLLGRKPRLRRPRCAGLTGLQPIPPRA
jgi:hypothetical protein